MRCRLHNSVRNIDSEVEEHVRQNIGGSAYKRKNHCAVRMSNKGCFEAGLVVQWESSEVHSESKLKKYEGNSMRKKPIKSMRLIDVRSPDSDTSGYRQWYFISERKTWKRDIDIAA